MHRERRSGAPLVASTSTLRLTSSAISAGNIWRWPSAQRYSIATLKFGADKRFFERELLRVDVVVHGRHSHEQQPHSHLRQRLIVTGRIAALAADPSNGRAMFWNLGVRRSTKPLAALGALDRRVGVMGGAISSVSSSISVTSSQYAGAARAAAPRPVGFPGRPRADARRGACQACARPRGPAAARSFAGLAVQASIRSLGQLTQDDHQLVIAIILRQLQTKRLQGEGSSVQVGGHNPFRDAVGVFDLDVHAGRSSTEIDLEARPIVRDAGIEM